GVVTDHLDERLAAREGHRGDRALLERRGAREYDDARVQRGDGPRGQTQRVRRDRGRTAASGRKAERGVEIRQAAQRLGRRLTESARDRIARAAPAPHRGLRRARADPAEPGVLDVPRRHFESGVDRAIVAAAGRGRCDQRYRRETSERQSAPTTQAYGQTE